MPCHKKRLDRALLSNTSWESHVRSLWPEQPSKANLHLGLALGHIPGLCPRMGKPPGLLSALSCWNKDFILGKLGLKWHNWESKSGVRGGDEKLMLWRGGSPSLFFHGGLLYFFLCPFLHVPLQRDPCVGDSCAASVSPVCGAEDASPVGRMWL